MKKVLYRHRRLDTNEVFYIGIGNKTRPYRNTYRNQYWHNIVNKHGYSVEILKTNLSVTDACELEEFLICEYGRKDLGKGMLCNMTDGGEGGFNQTVSEESKLKMRKAKLGKKLSKSHKLNISKSLLKLTGINRKKVINIETNIIYNSIKEASDNSKYSYSALRAQLSGQNKNVSNFKIIK